MQDTEDTAAVTAARGGPPEPSPYLQDDELAWAAKVIGSVSDIEGFDEVLEYGRAFRHADRPADDDDDPEES